MWDSRSFSAQSFDGRSWLGLLTTPYRELTRVQRVSVRTGLSAVYVPASVEQIVTFAATQRLTVLDAVTALSSMATVRRLVAMQAVNQRMPAERKLVPSAPKRSKSTSFVAVLQSVSQRSVVDGPRLMAVIGAPDRAFVAQAPRAVNTKG